MLDKLVLSVSEVSALYRYIGNVLDKSAFYTSFVVPISIYDKHFQYAV